MQAWSAYSAKKYREMFKKWGVCHTIRTTYSKESMKISSSFSFIHNSRFSIHYASRYIPYHRQISEEATHNLQSRCFGKNTLSDRSPSLSLHYLNDDPNQNVCEIACHTPHTQGAAILEASGLRMQYLPTVQRLVQSSTVWLKRQKRTW